MTGVLPGALQIERGVGALLARAAIMQLFRRAHVAFKYGQSANSIHFVRQRLDCFAELDSDACDRAMTALVNQAVLSWVAFNCDSYSAVRRNYDFTDIQTGR